MTKAASWSILIYGILLIILGSIGYIKGGSQMSMILGGGSGLLLILSSLAMFAKNKAGAYVAVILTLFLTALFAYRYTVAQKPIPAVLAVVSGCMLLFLIFQLKKKK